MIVILQFDSVNPSQFPNFWSRSAFAPSRAFGLVATGTTWKRQRPRSRELPISPCTAEWRWVTTVCIFRSCGRRRMDARRQDDFPAPEPVWDKIGRAGYRSLLIDPYESRPAKTMRGMALCGWQFRHNVTIDEWCLPKSLGRDLRSRLGRASCRRRGVRSSVDLRSLPNAQGGD